MHGRNMLLNLEAAAFILRTLFTRLCLLDLRRAPITWRGWRLSLLFISLTFLSACTRLETPVPVVQSFSSSPRLFLWAWERKEDLGFIDPKTTGIAYLASRICLQKTGITEFPRQQPLILPAHTKTIAVVRLEVPTKSRQGNEQAFIKELPESLINKIVSLCSAPDCLGLQLDFDARLSERQFYRRLISKIRSRLPHSKILSMTALASWVLYDDWIHDLPVNEFVPMFFEMGPETDKIMAGLHRGTLLTGRIKHPAIGLSTNELCRGKTLFKSKADILNADTRLYLFCRQAWTVQDYRTALKEVSSWR